MYNQCGSCPHCGAPIWTPGFYHSILPPTPIYTCDCRFQMVPRQLLPSYPPVPVLPTDRTEWGFPWTERTITICGAAA